MKTPRIVFWDIETSPLIGACFGLYEQNIHLVQDWFIICAAWRVSGEKTIHTTKLTDDKNRFKKDFKDDYHVIKTLYDIISGVDILVAHNGDNFDWKKFEARYIAHKMPPIKKPLLIDTLKYAKQFKFTSNKLDFLSKHFGYVGKLPSNMALWVGAAYGDEKAIRRMSRYNKGDIPPLEAVYNRFKPYIKGHPNMNLFGGKGCPKCGSSHIRRKGIEYARTATYQKYQCQDCGAWFQGEKTTTRSRYK